MVTEAIDLTGYDDWQLELLDKLQLTMLRFKGPASMFFALAVTKEEIPSELHGYLDSLAAEVLPYFCNEAERTNSVPGPFCNLKPVLHHNTFSEIKKLQLEADALRMATQESNDLKVMSTKTIFISHASKDEAIVDLFVHNFLRLGLEVRSREIFCTSLAGMGIPSGEDFRNAIKDKIISAELVFLLITPNYQSSQMCIAEMGAAWVLGKQVIPLIVPPIDYGTAGILVTPNQIIKLDVAANLDQLKADVEAALGIKDNVHLATWGVTRDKLLNDLKAIIEVDAGKK